MHGLTFRDRRPLIFVGWLGVVLATQAWPSWQSGISDLFAHDVLSYEAIAAAAPGLPAAPALVTHGHAVSYRLNVAFAQRFPVHWLVGTVSYLTGANLEDVYRVASVLCLLAVLGVMHRLLLHLRLEPGAYALCLGAVAASVFPLRYLLAAPGMLSDTVFVLGLAVVVLGFAEHRDLPVVAGVAIAAAARQTAVPLAFAVAIVFLLSRERPRGLLLAALTIATGVGIFEVESIVARPFSWYERGRVSGFGSLGTLDHPIRILTGNTGSDARAVVGIVVLLGLIAGAWLAGRAPAAIPAFLAATVALQPFVVFVGNNSSRLAGLAAPALVMVAAYQLRDLRLSPVMVWIGCAAILAGSFDARYSDVGVPDSTVWAAIAVLAAATVAVTTGSARIAVLVRRRPAQGQVPS